jgi:L-fuculose-phosphate aldolase
MAIRRAIVAAAQAMNALGINQGTSGNISVRHGKDLLVTPSGVPYPTMKPAMIARMPIAGDGDWTGPLKPSSEWRFHRDILRARADAGAVVHTHATYATVFSMLREAIPAAHYMVAAFGGVDVRCTAYAPYGTQELSDLALEGLRDRQAVLLGSHGMIAIGRDLDEAMWRAVELETLAKQTYLAKLAGRPVLLDEDEILRTVERFKGYGAAAQTPAARAPKRRQPSSK